MVQCGTPTVLPTASAIWRRPYRSASPPPRRPVLRRLLCHPWAVESKSRLFYSRLSLPNAGVSSFFASFKSQFSQESGSWDYCEHDQDLPRPRQDVTDRCAFRALRSGLHWRLHLRTESHNMISHTTSLFSFVLDGLLWSWIVNWERLYCDIGICRPRSSWDRELFINSMQLDCSPLLMAELACNHLMLCDW